MTIIREDFYDRGKFLSRSYYPFMKSGDCFGGCVATEVRPDSLSFYVEDSDGERHPFKVTADRPLLFDRTYRKALSAVPEKGCCELWTIVTAAEFMRDFAKGKKDRGHDFIDVLFRLYAEEPKFRSAILDYLLMDEGRPWQAPPFLYALYEKGLYGMEKDHLMAVYSLFSDALPKKTVLQYYQDHQEEIERDISVFGLNKAIEDPNPDVSCFRHFIGLEKARILLEDQGARMDDEEKAETYHFLREFIGFSDIDAEEDHVLRLAYAELVSCYGGPIGQRDRDEYMTVYDAMRIYAIERVLCDHPGQYDALLTEKHTEYTYDADTYAVEDEYEMA